MSPRRLASRLAVTLVALALALGAAELGVRVLDPHPSFARRAQAAYACDEHDPTLGWRGRANLDEPFVRPDFATRIRTNEHGFRTAPFAPKPAGTERVVVLGDSFGWGWGVERDERFDAVLEAELERDGRALDVVNLSVPGYGTDQELLTLRAHGAELAPDVVLLLFSHNDLKNVVATHQYGKPKPRFELARDGALTLTHVPVPNDERAWAERRRLALLPARDADGVPSWLERSQLANWLHARSATRSDAAVADAVERRRQADERVLEDGAELAAALLGAIRDEGERLGARLVVAWNPRRPEVAGKLAGSTWQAELERRLPDVDTIDLLPALQAEGGRLYFVDDPHWTARAHRCVGRALARAWPR